MTQNTVRKSSNVEVLRLLSSYHFKISCQQTPACLFACLFDYFPLTPLLTSSENPGTSEKLYCSFSIPKSYKNSIKKKKTWIQFCFFIYVFFVSTYLPYIMITFITVSLYLYVIYLNSFFTIPLPSSLTPVDLLYKGQHNKLQRFLNFPAWHGGTRL